MNDSSSNPVQVEDLRVATRSWGPFASRRQEPHAAAQGQVDDFKELMSLRAMQQAEEPDIVTELIDIFFQDTPARLEGVHQALRQADSRALEHAAHSLRGSCATIGARRMAQLCLALEKEGQAGRLQEAEVIFAALESAFTCVRRTLEGKRHGA
jgi:HPt (histidine-containing phosphotransfer) domain-containing protein